MKMMKTFKNCFLTAGAILLGGLAVLPANAQFSTYMSSLGPIDYWRLNDTATSPPIDIITNYGSAGAAGNGYVVGGLRGQSGGIVGHYLLLTNLPQNDDEVGQCYSRADIPNLAALNPPAPWTVEFWAMPAAGWTGGGGDTTGLCPLSSDSPFGASPDLDNRSGYLFYVTAQTWSIRIGGVNSYAAVATTTGHSVNPGSWTHIVATYDGTTLSLYTNGVLGAQGFALASAPFTPNGFTPTRIGGTALNGDEFEDGAGYAPPGGGNRGWNGGIDELAIYTNVLSSNTIYSHYTTAHAHPAIYDATILSNNPVGYWNFDEPPYTPPVPADDFTLALDIGSLHIEGTNTLGTLAHQPGVPGLGGDAASVYYNGAAGSLELNTNLATIEFNTDPDTTAVLDEYGNMVSPGDPQPISVAAWIKPTSFGYIENIVAQGTDFSFVADGYYSGNYAENFLRVGDNYDWESYSDDYAYGDASDYGLTQIVGPAALTPGVEYYSFGAFEGTGESASAQLAQFGFGGGGLYFDAFYPAPPGDLGNWVFLVGTYDPSVPAWDLYRNGTLVAQQYDFVDEGPVYVDMPWAVGSRSNPDPYFGFYFDGAIEEAALFQSTLNPEQILNLYNSVALPPVITQPLSLPGPVYLGYNVDLSVWADGPGGLSYEWFDGNTQLSDTGTNLVLSGVTTANSGTYTVIVTSPHGSVTNSIVLDVIPTLPPVNLASQTRWLNFPVTFYPAALSSEETYSYVWYTNGVLDPSDTTSNFTTVAIPANAGSYQLVIQNSFGSSTSAVVTLTVATPHDLYTETVLGDHPVAYFQMNETNGNIIYDFAGGNNGNYFGATLDQPGFDPLEFPDLTSAYFPGLVNTFAGNIAPTSISFPGYEPFTIEAWANGGSQQIDGAAVVVKGTGNNGSSSSEQFSLGLTVGNYRFYVTDAKNANNVEADSDVPADGVWHHLFGVYTGATTNGSYYFGGSLHSYQTNELYFYVDGQIIQQQGIIGPPNGDVASSDAISIGAERSGPTPTFDLPYNGSIDQVAIYNYALSGTQDSNHYAAAFGNTLKPQIELQPVSVTNYAGLPSVSNSFFIIPATFTVEAIGSYPLTYTWIKQGSGSVTSSPGTENPPNTLTLAPLNTGNDGTYTVIIANSQGSVTSAPVTLTVIPPPVTEPVIPGLVMHLKFDGNLLDSTGRGNNGTNMAATNSANGSTNSAVTASDYENGELGEAFYYWTLVGEGETNSVYATVGNRPDLQFYGNSFSVSMWVQTPQNFVGNDLPFFCDVVNSTFGTPGFCMEPTFGQGTALIPDWPGSEGCSFFGPGGGEGVYGYPIGNINDGLWHNLVYVVDTTATGGLTIYVDGTPDSYRREGGTTVIDMGSLDTTNVACIGQDPTGVYGQPSGGNSLINFGIDDLMVFDRALTPLQASSIWAAGAISGLSVTGAPLTTSYSVQNGTNLLINWNEGFLQSSTNLVGPWTTLTISPPAVLSPTNPATFYRVKF